MKTEKNVTETATATLEPTASTPTAPKVPQSSTITLTANGSTLQLVAERKADGSARTYVLTTDANKKTARGMTESHASFDAAKAAIATSAAKAEKLGWSRRVAGRKFVARPDAFTALPAVPKAAPVVKAKK